MDGVLHVDIYIENDLVNSIHIHLSPLVIRIHHIWFFLLLHEVILSTKEVLVSVDAD